MSVWFTSDVHLGHGKVAEDRGFDDVTDHDAAIYSAILDIMKRGDQLWILGDMTVGGTGAEAEALSRLGAIASMLGVEFHLIAGNHDSCHPMANRNSHKRQPVFLEVFSSVQLFTRRKIAGQQVMLSHFPYTGDHTDVDRGTQYRLRDEGLWLLHGHTHSREVTDGSRQLHIGWDAWRRLVHLDEIADIITTDGSNSDCREPIGIGHDSRP